MKRIFTFIAVLFSAVLVFAQGPQIQQLPDDPAVRKGKLDNGLTYYIRHNDKPAGRAEFYLATNVGAIQETPDQDGLAHFLEHMCFNGTKNFPDKALLEYLQSIGAEFGRNINAATGVEQTTYMLNNIPVSRTGIVDTCLLIMHDYSHFVTCDPIEIDKERGVIIEEKRSRNNASWRMREKSLPYYFGDSKYATCTLIGSQENLENFKPESLVSFYRTWYRPDLQAVIVVGDIDVDYVENKIKDLFGDIPAVENPTPKVMPVIPDNREPAVGIITDPEASITSIEMLWKRPARPEELNSTDAGMFLDLLNTYIAVIMNERFSDITSQPDAPFLGANFGNGNLCETCDVTMGDITCKDGQAIPAFKAFMAEIEKMKRFGFTDGEVSRAKDNILRAYEKAADAASTRTNSEFIDLYTANFFDNQAYMEPATEYEYAKSMCSQINRGLLNEVVAQMAPDTNLVILYKAPEKEGLAHPTEADFLTALEEVESAEIEANKEENIDRPLLDPASLKGAKVKKEKETIYGATEWTLKNGARVVVFPTDFKKDQVIIQLSKEGGRSIIATEDLPSFEDNIYELFEHNSGISEFPSTTLSKMLAGKSVSITSSIGGIRHGLIATASPKDLETAFQLLYLKFVDPRFDFDEYMLGIEQIKALLPNLETQPNFIFQNRMSKVLYGDNPRNIDISEEVLEKASMETIERVYRDQLFKDVAGATIYIVGNVDPATLKPLVEKYIGSLPKGRKATEWVDNIPEITKGRVEEVFTADMETPMNTVLQVWTAYIPYSVRNTVLLDAASYILDMVYTETLREEEGGTYGASANMSMQRLPKERALIQVYFNTNPEQSDKLRELAIKGLEDLANEGPTEEQIAMTVENFKKKIPESRISNTYWLSNIQNWYNYGGEDYDALYEAALDDINSENIKSILQSILEQGNFVEIVMGPSGQE